MCQHKHKKHNSQHKSNLAGSDAALVTINVYALTGRQLSVGAAERVHQLTKSLSVQSPSHPVPLLQHVLQQ